MACGSSLALYVLVPMRLPALCLYLQGVALLMALLVAQRTLVSESKTSFDAVQTTIWSCCSTLEREPLVGGVYAWIIQVCPRCRGVEGAYFLLLYHTRISKF